MNDYDASVNPPAPITSAEIAAPFGGSKVQETNMLLDSGAAMTCIPQKVISKLGNLPSDDPIKVVGPIGRAQRRKTYYVNISFDGHYFKMIRVIGIGGSRGLIGRDILNQLLTIFDGDHLVWRTK